MQSFGSSEKACIPCGGMIHREKEKERCEKEHEKYQRELTQYTNERTQLEQSAKNMSRIVRGEKV